MSFFNNIIPHKITDKDLIENERLVLIVHKHIYYIFKKLFLIFILLIFLWVLGIYALIQIQKVTTDIQQYLAYLYLGVFIFFNIILLFRILYIYIDYNYDNVFITNMRIIYIDRHFIFGQSVKEIALNRVTSIRSECNNLIANILGFSELSIDSADDNHHIVFQYTPRVDYVRTIITEQKEAFMSFIQEHNSSDGSEFASVNPHNYVQKSDYVNKPMNNNQNSLEGLLNEINLLKEQKSNLEERINQVETNLKKIIP